MSLRTTRGSVGPRCRRLVTRSREIATRVTGGAADVGFLFPRGRTRSSRVSRGTHCYSASSSRRKPWFFAGKTRRRRSTAARLPEGSLAAKLRPPGFSGLLIPNPAMVSLAVASIYGSKNRGRRTIIEIPASQSSDTILDCNAPSLLLQIFGTCE